MKRRHALALVLGCAGCLTPFGDDTPTYSPNLLAPGTPVPTLADDPELADRIGGADGVPADVVPLHDGYAAGVPVRYWDFGPVPRFAVTVFELRRCDAMGAPLPGGEGHVDHPGIVESAPGDPSYSPFLRVWTACVTDRWTGQGIPSLAALEDAVTLGLLTEPVPTNTWRNSPIVAPRVTLEVGGGGPAVEASGIVYYRGRAMPTFTLGATAGEYTSTSPLLKSGRVYRIRRANDSSFLEVVFSTPRRNGDAPNAAYVPLLRVIHVTMKASYVAGGATSESELFTVAGTTYTPVHADISSFEVTEQYVNHEIQYAEGTP